MCYRMLITFNIYVYILLFCLFSYICCIEFIVFIGYVYIYIYIYTYVYIYIYIYIYIYTIHVSNKLSNNWDHSLP